MCIELMLTQTYCLQFAIICCKCHIVLILSCTDVRVSSITSYVWNCTEFYSSIKFLIHDITVLIIEEICYLVVWHRFSKLHPKFQTKKLEINKCNVHGLNCYIDLKPKSQIWKNLSWMQVVGMICCRKSCPILTWIYHKFLRIWPQFFETVNHHWDIYLSFQIVSVIRNLLFMFVVCFHY